MTNELPADIPSDEALKRFLKDIHRQYTITGINPTDEDHLSRTVAYLEWQLTVAILAQTLQLFNQPNPQKILSLTHPQMTSKGNGVSMIAMFVTADEENLTSSINKAISDTKEATARFDVKIDEEKMASSMRDLFTFLEKNTGGIEVKLLDEVVQQGIFRISTSTDPQAQVRTQALQALSESMMGDMMEQKLVGINPTGPDGEELSIEIAYWMAGFSATCTFTSAFNMSDQEITTALVQTGMKVLMRESVTIEPPLHQVIRDSLEDILANKRMTLIQSGMKSFENPMVNQYVATNMGKFDKDTHITTMESILKFMKANEGFRTG